MSYIYKKEQIGQARPTYTETSRTGWHRKSIAQIALASPNNHSINCFTGFKLLILIPSRAILFGKLGCSGGAEAKSWVRHRERGD